MLPEMSAVIFAEDSAVRATRTGLYRKEFLKVGKHVIDGKECSIDAADIDLICAETVRALDNGVKLPVPLGHENVGKAEMSRGWITDAERIGDSGFVTLALADETPEKLDALVRNNDISMHAEKSWKDEKGVEYHWALRHAALTPRPLFTGLGEFQKIAASLAPLEKPVEKKTETVDVITAAMPALVSAKRDLYEARIAALANPDADGTVRLSPHEATTLRAALTDGVLTRIVASAGADGKSAEADKALDACLAIMASMKPISLKGKTGRQDVTVLADGRKAGAAGDDPVAEWIEKTYGTK